MTPEEKQMVTRVRSALTLILKPTISIFAYAGLVSAFLLVSNSDLEGRLTKTLVVETPNIKPNDDAPTIRLVLHRLLPDENAVEVSTILTIPDRTAAALHSSGIAYLEAQVEDGSSTLPYALTTNLRLNTDATIPGWSSESVEGPRFMLPFYPSIAGFPFDETHLRVGMRVNFPDNTFFRNPNVEIEKALPGRVLSVKEDSGFVEITLSRGLLDKIFVIFGAAVFLLLSLLIGFLLMKTDAKVGSLEGIVAIAGFILASAGYRDFLGVPKANGVTVADVITFGVPFAFLIVAVIISVIRERVQAARKPPQDVTES